MTILQRLEAAGAQLRETITRLFSRTRRYRFAGEKEALAEQLRETTVSLSLMANADPSDPDQVRMASDVEHGAELRLGVLLKKPILALEEKRERDAIQAALQARRQGFDAPAGWEARPSTTRPSGFLGSLAGMAGGWQAYALIGVFALSGWGVAAVQGALKERVEHQRNEARHERDAAQRALQEAREVAQRMAQLVRQADTQARESAETIERERAIAQRALAQQRRARHDDEVAARDRGEPIDWGLPVGGPEGSPARDGDSGAGSPR